MCVCASMSARACVCLLVSVIYNWFKQTYNPYERERQRRLRWNPLPASTSQGPLHAALTTLQVLSLVIWANCPSFPSTLLKDWVRVFARIWVLETSPSIAFWFRVCALEGSDESHRDAGQTGGLTAGRQSHQWPGHSLEKPPCHLQTQ